MKVKIFPFATVVGLIIFTTFSATKGDITLISPSTTPTSAMQMRMEEDANTEVRPMQSPQEEIGFDLHILNSSDTDAANSFSARGSAGQQRHHYNKMVNRQDYYGLTGHGIDNGLIVSADAGADYGYGPGNGLGVEELQSGQIAAGYLNGYNAQHSGLGHYSSGVLTDSTYFGHGHGFDGYSAGHGQSIETGYNNHYHHHHQHHQHHGEYYGTGSQSIHDFGNYYRAYDDEESASDYEGYAIL